jgi:hypothetical protein
MAQRFGVWLVLSVAFVYANPILAADLVATDRATVSGLSLIHI